MDKQTLLRKVPALRTAETVGRSDRYQVVNTESLVDLMAQQGFDVASAQQVRSKAGNERFGKHLLRFRSAAYDVGMKDSIPEIILVNSHDGGSAYRMMAGIFRFACANGIIIADSTLAEVRIRHDAPNVGQEVIAAAYRIVNRTNDVADVVGAWKNLVLNQDQQIEYFKGAKALYDPEDKLEMNAGRLLAPHRQADEDGSLWSTFNILQEKFMRGNFYAYNRESGQRRRGREITSIDRNVKLNRDLWEYTAAFNLN